MKSHTKFGGTSLILSLKLLNGRKVLPFHTHKIQHPTQVSPLTTSTCSTTTTSQLTEESVQLIQKETIKSVEKKMQEGDVDQVLTGRDNLSAYTKRTRNELLDSTKNNHDIKKRSHGPKIVNCYIESVISKLQEHIEKPVNWEELAKKNGLTMKNKGQVLKEQLVKKGYDISKHCNSMKRKSNVEYHRRPLKRICELNISMPKHLSENIRDEIKSRIQTGEIDIREGITVDGYVRWRKSLIRLREKMLAEEIDYKILRNGCGIRNLKVWTDGSTINNKLTELTFPIL